MKWFLFLSIFALVGAKKFQPQTVEDAAYWKQMGQDLLRQELNKRPINTAAKNVIFFLGDGMSIATVTAARIYKGQLAGQSGEEGHLSFDKFPYGALSRTYCVDAQVADSACSATAFLCGVKGNANTIGLDSNAIHKNCDTQNNPENRVDSIMTWAQEAKKGTGVVTTTRITHATPAGSYAHVASRLWEDDSFVLRDKADTSTCDDIAEQLVEHSPGKNFKVMLGGGRYGFLPKNISEPGKGNRLDGKNLIETWKVANPKGVYVTTDKQLSDIDFDGTDKLLGLFSDSLLPYNLESEGTETPTLTEMTQAAIKMLEKEAYGYVLLVEGANIDMGHHAGQAKLALDETVQFDLAIEAAVSMTNRSDTLIIVTADHAHTMTINGYPKRGNDIFGFAQKSLIDKKPYTTLSYANGPGYATAFDESGERPDLTNTDTTDKDFKQPATVPNIVESHGGEEVAIYAVGPQAHLFQGVYEQNYIAHVIGYAACIGPGMKFCDGNTQTLLSMSPSDRCTLV